MLKKFGKMGLGASIGKSVPIEVLPKTKPMTFEIITRPYVLGLFEGTVELYKGTFEDIPGADYSDIDVVSEKLIATQQLQAYPNYTPITFQIPYDDDYEVYFIKIKNFTPASAFSDIKWSIDEWCLNTHNYPRFGYDSEGNVIKNHSAYNRFDLTHAVYYETVYKVLDENNELITDRKYVGFYSTRKNDSNSIYFFDKEDDLEKVEHNVPGELMLCREYFVDLDSGKSPYDITKVIIRKYNEPIAEEDMYWSGSSLPTEYENQMTVYAPPGYTYEIKYNPWHTFDLEAPTSVLYPKPTKKMTFEFITPPYTRGLLWAQINLYKGTWDEDDNLISEENTWKEGILKPYPDYTPITFDIPAEDDYKDYFIKIRHIAIPSPLGAIMTAFSIADKMFGETTTEKLLWDWVNDTTFSHNLKAHNVIDLSTIMAYKTTLALVDSEGKVLNDRRYSAKCVLENGDEINFYDIWTDENDGSETKNICCLTDIGTYLYQVSANAPLVKTSHYVINKHVSTFDDDVISGNGSRLPEIESSMIVHAYPGFFYKVEFVPDGEITLDCDASNLVPSTTTD